MILKSPIHSENPAPIIPKGRPISGDDWLKGRRDHRLRPLFNGELGLPFKKTLDL